MVTAAELEECRRLLERIVEACEAGELVASGRMLAELRGALAALIVLDSVRDTNV